MQALMAAHFRPFNRKPGVTDRALYILVNYRLRAGWNYDKSLMSGGNGTRGAEE